MSPIEVPKGEDPLLKEIPASEQNAEQTDKKNPDKKEQNENKESIQKPKDDVTKEGIAKIEERIAKQDVKLNTIKKRNPEEEVAAMRKRMDQKKEHLGDADIAADLVTDTTTALQAPEAVTKPRPVVPEGEDRQEAQLVKGKEVDQKEIAKKSETPEAKVNPEVPQTEVAAVQQKTEVKTEQIAQRDDAQKAMRPESVDQAGGAGTNKTGGGQVA